MWDYNASEYLGENLYRGCPSTVPGWHDVQLFFWEPSANINPHAVQRPIVSNEPIHRAGSLSSAAENLFFELNSPMTCLFTERLNGAGPRRYDTTTTVPFSYNGSHYGAGWVGRLNWILEEPYQTWHDSIFFTPHLSSSALSWDNYLNVWTILFLASYQLSDKYPVSHVVEWGNICISFSFPFPPQRTSLGHLFLEFW